MDNKYKQLMNNVEVTGDMRDRILRNIGAMDIKAGSGSVRTVPVSAAGRARISRIIGIVAAAGIVLSVGGLILFRLADGKDKSSAAPVKNMSNDVAVEADAELGNVDSMDDNTQSIHGKNEGPANYAAETIADDRKSFIFPNGGSRAGGTGGVSSFAVRSITLIRNDGTGSVMNDSSSINELMNKLSELDLVLAGGTEVSGYELILSGDSKKMTVVIGGEFVRVADDVYRSMNPDHDKIAEEIREMFS